jgi:hypothetical protein
MNVFRRLWIVVDAFTSSIARLGATIDELDNLLRDRLGGNLEPQALESKESLDKHRALPNAKREKAARSS